MLFERTAQGPKDMRTCGFRLILKSSSIGHMHKYLGYQSEVSSPVWRSDDGKSKDYTKGQSFEGR